MEKYSVKKPFTILVMVLTIIILGIVSLTSMTTDLLPDINLPYMIVVTTYPGASPEKVESDICEPMESALGSVNGVKNVMSVANENYGIVELEFEDGTDMDSAMVKVSSALDPVKDILPEECGTPSLMEIGTDMMATQYLSIGYEDMSIEELTAFVEDTVVPRLERQNGVTSISSIGMVEKTIQVELNQEKVDKINDKILAKTNDAFADAVEQLDEAKQQIIDGQNEIDENKKKMQDSEKELADGKQELIDGQKELEDGKQELIDKQKELDDAKQKLQDGKNELENKKNETYNKLAQASLAADQLSAYQAQLVQQQASMEATEEILKQIEKNPKKVEEVNKKIIEIGNEIVAPLDAEVIDAKGCLVLPGFIDAHTHLGLWEDGMGSEGADGNEETDPVTPHLNPIDGMNPMDRNFTEAVQGGITSVCTTPGSANVMGGQCIAIKTFGKIIDKMVIKNPSYNIKRIINYLNN